MERCSSDLYGRRHSAIAVQVTKKKPKLSVPKCPLCRSKIFHLSIDSGNKLKADKGRLIGVILGNATMRATCAKGCEIIVREATKPGVTGELSPIPRPTKKRPAKRSAAAKAGLR